MDGASPRTLIHPPRSSYYATLLGVPPLTVTIITRNEARHVEEVLRSVSWADETLVVDAESTDETVAVARRHASRVVTHAWEGYGAQKNHAAELASYDWILSIDADERVTPDLAREIREILQSDPAAAAFRIPRVTFYLGRWIRSTDWHPDWQIRLYDRRRTQWNTRHVHESLEVRGGLPSLHGELQHFPYRNLSEYLSKIDRYTSLAARQMQDEGRHAGRLDLLTHPPLAFLRNYVLKRGCLDGAPGLIVSLLNSYYVFLKFAKLWELQQQHGPR